MAVYSGAVARGGTGARGVTEYRRRNILYYIIYVHGAGCIMEIDTS